MSQLDLSTVAHLKKLARISCTPEEEANLLESLSRILKHIEKLEEVDTENVKPCSYVLSSMLKTKTRRDEVGDLLPRDLFLKNAPDQIGGMIRVPPVLKNH